LPDLALHAGMLTLEDRVNRMAELPNLPPGSDRVAEWARRVRLSYQPHPDPNWFRAWEPYDTLVSASAHFNCVAFGIPPNRSIARSSLS
jgi:hypothetical protein